MQTMKPQPTATRAKFVRLTTEKERKEFYASLSGPKWWVNGKRKDPIKVGSKCLSSPGGNVSFAGVTWWQAPMPLWKPRKSIWCRVRSSNRDHVEKVLRERAGE